VQAIHQMVYAEQQGPPTIPAWSSGVFRIRRANQIKQLLDSILSFKDQQKARTSADVLDIKLKTKKFLKLICGTIDI